MSDVFYLRPVDPPATPEAVLDSIHYAGGCFDLHRVDWAHSFLAADGCRMLCWYRAPDAESARLALRDLGADMGAVWPGHVIGGIEPRDASVSTVSVLAEVSLPQEAARDDDELLEGLRQSVRRELGNAELPFGFVANRRDRMVCLLAADDPAAVRSALASGGFADASAWACTVVTPPARAQRNSNPR